MSFNAKTLDYMEEGDWKAGSRLKSRPYPGRAGTKLVE
jgi:hypothetical protein